VTKDSISQRRNKLLLYSVVVLNVFLMAALTSVTVLVINYRQQSTKDAVRLANANKAIAECININLGLRAKPGADDLIAQQEWLTEINEYFQEVQKGAVVDKLRIPTATVKYQAALNADAAVRAAHPLGQC